MANTFDWIEIGTRDIEKTAAFYEEVFGWRVVRKDGADGTAVWIFDTGGEPRVENLRRGGMWLRPHHEPDVVVYILVDDIEATLRKVTELGGRIVIPKTPQGSCWRAAFADPDGNTLALWEEKAVA